MNNAGYASPRYFGPGKHPKWPLQNRIPQKCNAALDLRGKYGCPRRMWIGELGWGLKEDADPLSEYSMDFAACVCRALITAKSVPDVEKMLYFTMRGCNEDGYEYGLTRGRPLYPLPAASAYATCAYLLDGGRPVQRMQLTADLQCASFADRARDRLIFAFFSTGQRAGIEPPASAPPGRWFNSFMQRPRRSGDAVAIDRLPIYWVLPLDETGTRPEFLKDLTAVAPEPVQMRNAWLSRADELAVLLQNRTTDIQQVQIRAADIAQTITVPPTEKPALHRLSLPKTVGIPRGKALPVSVTCDDTTTSRDVKVSATTLPAPPPEFAPDGDIDEWGNHKPFEIDDRRSILPSDPNIGWSGPADLSIKAYLAADTRSLYFAAIVGDDVHAAPNVAAGNFWQSDSIQLAVDPRNDSREAYDEDDREIGFVLGEGKGRAYGTHPGAWDDFDVPLSIIRANGHTIYEASLPWKALDIGPPEPGDIMGINFIANENDGSGRACWMGLTPGIGESKAPVAYRQFVIAPD